MSKYPWGGLLRNGRKWRGGGEYPHPQDAKMEGVEILCFEDFGAKFGGL